MARDKPWQGVYEAKADRELSWTQAASLTMIEEACLPTTGARGIDVGGGTSPLAGRLLDAGYEVAADQKGVRYRCLL